MPKKKGRSQRPLTTAPALVQEVDDSLVDDLLAQLDSQDNGPTLVSTQQAPSQIEFQKQSAKSRFLARQARKAAAVAQSSVEDDPATQARLQQEIKKEEEAIQRTCDQLGVQIFHARPLCSKRINPDGHCLFSAVADQLSLLGVIPTSESNYKTVRGAAADYIQRHSDDFIPFLPSMGEDGTEDVMSLKEFEQYCASIRDTAEWGGEPEILALSRTYNIPIHVVQAGPPAVVKHEPEYADANAPREKTVFISYHRKLYGLGEHYNSLRRIGNSIQIAA
ncbi:hypothetical protein M378DRAFT_184114 [Amanita muscaria Koide BX008]|uniref:OTU domain-containing protein n=1 Tax=Amanita muscaria (strain Koide BX008) TaxID=946122 RepID=A0A0C2TR09_AMAMK|nr:hypothetical protein M378DRAFT_184114 [Amanita muscaria Koide BX008]